MQGSGVFAGSLMNAKSESCVRITVGCVIFIYLSIPLEKVLINHLPTSYRFNNRTYLGENFVILKNKNPLR